MDRHDNEDLRLLLQQQIHNILTLQQEVAELKYSQSAAKTEMYNSVDLRMKELKEQINREKEDRGISWSMLCDKIVNAESEIKLLQDNIREERSPPDEFARLNARMEELEKDALTRMQQRTDDLEKLILGSVAEQRQKAGESIEAWKAMKESHQALMQSVQQELPSRFLPRMDRVEAALEERVRKADDSKAEMEKLVGDAQVQMTEYVNKITKARGEYHDGIKDRLQEFNDNLHEMMKLQMKALVSTEEKLKQVAERLQTLKEDGVSNDVLQGMKATLQEEQEKTDKALTDMRAVVDGVQGMVGELKAKHEEHSQDVAGSSSKALEQLQEAHAKLTEFITKEAETRTMYHNSVHERLSHLENTLGEISLSHGKVMEITHDQFEANDTRLASCEENAKVLAEAIHIKADRIALEGAAKDLESNLSAISDRVDTAEKASGETRAKLTETLAAAQTKIAEHIAKEAGASEQRAAAETERSGRIDGQLKEILETHAKDRKRLDTQEERLSRAESFLETRVTGSESKSVEGGSSQVAATSLGVVQREIATRDQQAADGGELTPTPADKQASALVLAKKLSEIENTLADVIASQKKQVQDQTTARLNEPPVATALPANVGEALRAMQQKLEYLEQHASSSNTLSAKSLRATHEKFQQVHGRLAACETSAGSQGGAAEAQGGVAELLEALEKKILEALDAYGEELEVVKSGHRVRDDRHADLLRRISFLEVTTKDEGDAQRKDLEAFDERITQLTGNVANDRSALEAHHKQVQEFLEREKKAHDAEMDSFKDSLGEMATSHAEALKLARERSSQDVQSQQGVFKDLLKQLEERLSASFDGLKSEFAEEKKLTVRREKETLDRFEGERKAREALDNSLQSAAFVDTKSREALERWVKEHQGHEQAARERHQSHIQDLLRREKDERQRHQELQQEYVKREAEAHESQLKSLYEILQKEASMRETHQRSMQKAYEKLEDRFEKEKQDQMEQFNGTAARVNQSERSLSDALGAEKSERQADVVRIWHAIDNHTHELDSGPPLAPSSSRTAPYAGERPSAPGGYPKVKQAELIGYGAPPDRIHTSSPGGASGGSSPSLGGGIQPSPSPWGGVKPDLFSNTLLPDHSSQSTPMHGRQMGFAEPSPRVTPWA